MPIKWLEVWQSMFKHPVCTLAAFLNLTLAGFWRLVQLCGGGSDEGGDDGGGRVVSGFSYSGSTCCSRRRLNSVATWITGAHQKLLLRSKNENSNLLYSVVVHSTNSPSRLSERLPGWCRGMCPARGGVQKLQKTTFACHLTPGQNFLIFHCHFSVYENADENAGRSLMNH
mgnify:CR=1 FL=1